MPQNSRNDPTFLDRRLSLLSHVTSTVIGSMSLQEQAQRMVAQVQAGFGVDSSVARLLEGDELRLLASVGLPKHQLHASLYAHDGISGRMIRERRPFMINNVKTDPLTAEKYRDEPTAFRFLSYCGAPMLVEDRVVGILGIYSQRETDFFHPVDLDHLQVVANHIAAAIANAQRVEELQEEVRTRQRFEDALQELNTQLEHRVEQRTSELRVSEERYRLLAEYASDMISRHGKDGRFTYVSPASVTMLGYPQEEMLGHRPREFVHPDDQERVISALPELLTSRNVVTRTYRMRHREGGYRWLESASRQILHPGTGELEEIVVISRDVTDRMLAQEQLRLVQAAIDGVREAVLVTEPELDPPGPRIVYVNPAFCTMTGYEPKEVLGQTPRILQGPRTDKALLRRLRETLLAGRSFRGETVNYRKDGSEYFVEWDINPILDDAGRLTHWVSIQRDITDRKQAEQVAREHQEELAHVSRLSTMGEMASGLAHELNQPLAAISNYANGCLTRLNSGATEEEQVRETLHRVARQAERAGQIIKRLRAFVAKRASVRTSVDLNELVQDVLTLCEPEARQSDITIQTDLHPYLSRVHVDEIQIEQVVLNLLRNAIEAVADCPPAHRQVQVRTYPGDGGEVCLMVADEGPGLNDEQLNHLFDPFFTTKQGGMGMGLTISQSIVEAHHGKLLAQRRPERGACLLMRLNPRATCG